MKEVSKESMNYLIGNFRPFPWADSVYLGPTVVRDAVSIL